MMTTPRSMTSEDLEAHLADKLATIDERVEAVCADPAVADKLRLNGGLVPLAQLRETVKRHNATRTAWTSDEAAELVSFLGDLVHDVELIREMLAFPTYMGLPRVLREERLGE